MSLSFVSSAVLSSTDGVSHNEEKPIESTETRALRSANTGVSPLFEQLRTNREAEQEKRDEAAKALRGTRALDDEDCAHLDVVERVRMEREARIRDEVEDEVAAFRAARADRMVAGSEQANDVSAVEETERYGPKSALHDSGPKKNMPTLLSSINPRIIVKKRRRRQQNGETDRCDGGDGPGVGETKKPKNDSEEEKDSSGKSSKTPSRASHEITEAHGDGGNKESDGLGDLLGGYGSDSDSD